MNWPIVTGVVLLCSPFLTAGMIGNTVTLTKYFPDLSSPIASDSFVVTDPGIEDDCPSSSCFMQPGAYALDLNDNSIAFQMNLIGGLGLNRDPDPFNGYVFTGLDLGGPITGVQFSQTGFTGLTLSDVSFTANSVSINLQDTEAEIDASWLITLESGVPEPGTWALMALGLAGIAARTRIRR